MKTFIHRGCMNTSEVKKERSNTKVFNRSTLRNRSILFSIHRPLDEIILYANLESTKTAVFI